MPASPRVSIIVPNYNHSRFLRERLDSIQRQTYRDFECLLLDDASTDGSVEILREYQERLGARLIINEKNSGTPFAQWNLGVSQARGEYVWLAESDDVAEPNFLETLVECLDRNPQVGVVCCDSIAINELSAPLRKMDRAFVGESAEAWSRDFVMSGRAFVTKSLYQGNSIASASAVVFRRDVYVNAGWANTEFVIGGDLLQWIKMLMQSDFGFVAQPLSYSRTHARNQRHTNGCNGRMETETMKVQEWVRSQMEIPSASIRRGAFRYARSWLDAVRSGRYRNNPWNHLRFFKQLFSVDRLVAATFLLLLPACLIFWFFRRSRA